jgi:hypothetical protein
MDFNLIQQTVRSTYVHAEKRQIPNAQHLQNGVRACVCVWARGERERSYFQIGSMNL